MPILESASLQVFAGRDPFSPGILSQAPRLTKLSILDFYVSWDASIFSQLTELELVFNTNVRPPITVAGMNALFQRTALLEYLLIEEMFPVDIEVVDGAPAPSSAVHVPVSLSHLHVKAINSFADELIFSTSIVRAEHTRLMVDARRCVAEDLPNVKRCLARHAGSKPPKALAVFLETPWMKDGAYSYGPVGISIGVWHTLSDQLFETSSAPVDVTVQWSIRMAEPDEVEHLPILPSLIDYGLPVQDIVDVSLNFEFDLSLDDYIVLFQQMTRVQRLRITERTAVDLFAAFAPVVRTTLSSTSSDASDTQPPPLFGLSKLYIVDDSSSWTVPPDYAKGQIWTPNLDYGPVVECIRLRKASGRPLEELHIPRKYQGESWVEQVRVLVGVVGWSKPEWL